MKSNVKSVTTSNGGCDLPITTLLFICCTDKDTKLEYKPFGRPRRTQNSQQHHWERQVQLGAGWMHKKQSKKAHLIILNHFCKIYIIYINSVLHVVHTIPVCHPLDHQASDHHKTAPHTLPCSYSSMTQKCWHTILHSRTPPGHTHLHPHHICREAKTNKLLCMRAVKMICIKVKEKNKK